MLVVQADKHDGAERCRERDPQGALSEQQSGGHDHERAADTWPDLKAHAQQTGNWKSAKADEEQERAHAVWQAP